MYWYGGFKEVITPKLKGYVSLIVYVDDFVVTFQYKSDAEWFYEHLKHRMGHLLLPFLWNYGQYRKYNGIPI